MPIQTRLTERLGITHPILSAPMGFVAGGRLAAAVTAAGGLGLIGGGYGDWKPSTFRIGHMGEVRESDLEALLAEIDSILEELS